MENVSRIAWYLTAFNRTSVKSSSKFSLVVFYLQLKHECRFKDRIFDTAEFWTFHSVFYICVRLAYVYRASRLLAHLLWHPNFYDVAGASVGNTMYSECYLWFFHFLSTSAVLYSQWMSFKLDLLITVVATLYSRKVLCLTMLVDNGSHRSLHNQ